MDSGKEAKSQEAREFIWTARRAARVQSHPARGKPAGATVPNANGRPRTFRCSLHPYFPTQPSFSGRTAAQPDGSGAAAGTGGSA